jgi:hypothetical protein
MEEPSGTDLLLFPASSLPESVMGTFNSADFVIVGQPVSKYYVLSGYDEFPVVV